MKWRAHGVGHGVPSAWVDSKQVHAGNTYIFKILASSLRKGFGEVVKRGEAESGTGSKLGTKLNSRPCKLGHFFFSSEDKKLFEKQIGFISSASWTWKSDQTQFVNCFTFLEGSWKLFKAWQERAPWSKTLESDSNIRLHCCGWFAEGPRNLGRSCPEGDVKGLTKH